MKAGLRLGAAIVGLLLFGGGVLYILFSRPAPVQAELQVLQVLADCQLDLADCMARDEAGHQLQVSLFPRPVPLMQAVHVIVTPEGFHPVHAVEIEVEGVNMFMGLQRTALQVSAGHWAGNIALPICSKTLMHWQANIQIKTDTTHYQAVFPFSTSR